MRTMTPVPPVLHRPSGGPMVADVARAGISRQQSPSIPSGIRPAEVSRDTFNQPQLDHCRSP